MQKRTRLIPLLMACVMLISGCGNRATSAATREKPSDVIIFLDELVPLSDGIEKSVCGEAFEIINKYREANNVAPLVWSPQLESCAEVRAEECATNWSHTRPNGKPWYTVNEQIMYGENLAKNYSTSNELVAAWMASPAHNENLLWADFRYIAIVEYNGYFACEFS